MVSTVRNGCRYKSQNEEEQSGSKVRAHQQRTEDRRQHVTEDVLNGMSIDGSHTDWCRPFVVYLVNMTVQIRIVKQTGATITNRQHVNSTSHNRFRINSR